MHLNNLAPLPSSEGVRGQVGSRFVELQTLMCINLNLLSPFLVLITPIGYKEFSDFTLGIRKTTALQGFSTQ